MPPDLRRLTAGRTVAGGDDTFGGQQCSQQASQKTTISLAPACTCCEMETPGKHSPKQT